MFGKKTIQKKWEPSFDFIGKNIVRIRFTDSETLDYLIGQNYKILATSGGRFEYAVDDIILLKPTLLQKCEEES